MFPNFIWLSFFAALTKLHQFFSKSWRFFTVLFVLFSQKRNFCLRLAVLEGVYLHRTVLSPYEGDVFHEPPLALMFYDWLTTLDSLLVRALFVATDVLAALALALAARRFFSATVRAQHDARHTFHQGARSQAVLLFKSSVNPFWILQDS